MEEASLHLQLEFIEKSKDKKRKPAASTEDDKRICACLREESARIRMDAVKRIKQVFEEMASMSADTFIQLEDLDKLIRNWDLNVMHMTESRRIFSENDRLLFTQIGNTAKAQIERLKLLGVNW